MATVKKRRGRVALPKRKINLETLNVWSPSQTARWSGINYRQLMRLLHAGVIPHIVGAPARPTATSKRVYLIPREAFQRWLRNVGQSDATTNANNNIAETAA
jgi:hypothetical protein